MLDCSFQNLCIHHLAEGLREGLSHFSQASRVAVIYAVNPDDPICVYDPQLLLRGHEPKLGELYLDADNWMKNAASPLRQMNEFEEVTYEKNLELSGLISYGGRSRTVFYQMWFTEHHPNMCSTGPTERWLEHAVWLFSQGLAAKNISWVGTSGYVIREYASHAVRDYIVDRRSLILGWDTQLRIYPILDAVLGISKTLEEGFWPRGELVFIEPSTLPAIRFLARFPQSEMPFLKNFKHVRKLLLTVENSERKLISDGKNIVGIAAGPMPESCVIADFRGGYGFLRLNGDLMCSFYDGNFHSSNRKANLVQVEEILLESGLDMTSGNFLFRIISEIVHTAQDKGYGCTLVVDLNDPPLDISGQHIERPLDLRKANFLELAKSLAKVDGALHIGAEVKLHNFACLLDGRAVPGENRARGARFNSALRFSAEHKHIFVVVVSADRPVSVIQEGVELSAQCEWKSPSAHFAPPPDLKQFIENH